MGNARERIEPRQRRIAGIRRIRLDDYERYTIWRLGDTLFSVAQVAIFGQHGRGTLVFVRRSHARDPVFVVTHHALHCRRDETNMKHIGIIILLIVVYFVGAKFPGPAQKVLGML
jgi:hypothetical protein